MPFRSPQHPNLNSIISDLYSGIDTSVIKNNAYLERLQRNCVEQANPFTCYFTLLLSTPPQITWRHNTGRHFGIVDLQYEDFFNLVHPAWLFVCVSYAGAVYEVAHDFADQLQGEGASTGFLVPLLHRSGKYFWYHQISVQVAFEGGVMAAHLNYYHQSTAYAGQLPTMPKLTTSGEVNKGLMKELNKRAVEFLPGFLAQFLSETQVVFMIRYRQVIHTHGEKKMTQGNLLKLIDEVDTIENLNKIRQRIKKSTITFFKHPSLDSAFGLGVWLNRYFPIL